MATVQSLLFFAFAIISLSSQIIIVAKPSSPRRLVINLIHCDSPHSPYHRKNENSTARIQRTMAISSIYSRSEKFRRSFPTSGLYAELYPFNGFFLVNFSIGHPRVPQLAIMDTGSSLLWVQCSPCLRCSSQYSPIFNSEKSSTFTRLPCSSEYCIFPKPSYASCTSFDPCDYHQKYTGSAVYSMGVLAKEQLLFHTSDHGSIVVQDVVFGCGDMNGNIENANRLMSGVFGLGFEKISLATRFSKFSYCIGNIFGPNYMHNKLVLGTEGWTEGDSTPVRVINGHYHVVLEGISVGERSLLIDLNPFRWNGEENSGVIIDSGSVATHLIKEGYEPLLKTIHDLLDTWFTQIPEKTREKEPALCYRGNMNQDLLGFPTVTFHFHGGAELVLDARSLFFQYRPDEFCLTVLPSYANEKLGNASIIGLLAQQNYNVGYDIFGKTMSFQKIDCELL